jgi:tetratricopeptide (TPR) repeat protein
VEQWWLQVKEVDRLGRRCEALCRASGNQAGLANVLGRLSANLLFLRPLDEALVAAEAAVELCYALDLNDTLLQTTSWRALVLVFQGNYAQAQVVSQAGDVLAHELGNLRYLAENRRTTGLIALGEKRCDAAQQNLQASLIGFQAARNQFHQDITVSYLGIAEFHLGNMDVARQHLLAALRLTMTDSHAHVFLVQSALYLAALHLNHRGAAERAIEIYGLLSSLWLAGTPQLYEDIVGQYIDAAAASLPAVDVAAAQERGRTLDLWVTAKALLAEFEEQA